MEGATQVAKLSLVIRLLDVFFESISWNVQGLQNWKLDDFLSELKSDEILFLLDTCVDSSFELDLDNYVYFKPRKTNDGTMYNHGGIGIAIKRHLRNSKAVKMLEEKSSKQCDILWLKCDKQHFNLDNDVYICGTYIPPHNSKYLKDNSFDMFSLIENDVI